MDLSYYKTKSDLKEIPGVDTSKLAAKTDFASLEAEVGNLDVKILKTVPANLSELSNVVDNDVVKKRCMIYWSPKYQGTEY